MSKFVGIMSRPVNILVLVWLAIIAIFYLGPVRYLDTPNILIIAVILGGLAVVYTGSVVGLGLPTPDSTGEPDIPLISRTVATASAVGLLGIGAIAMDRLVLSGVDGATYATLLRCAPDLVDKIEMRRTPLLYLGYLTFSFAYAGTVLFWLNSEKCGRWAAALAQLAVISPIAYALIYGGRMPMLLIGTLVIGAGIVRLARGRSFAPRGHFLLAKLFVAALAFGAYSLLLSDSRQDACVAMSQILPALTETGSISASDIRDVGDVVERGAVERATADAQEADNNPDTAHSQAGKDFAVASASELGRWSAAPADYMVNLVERGLPPGIARLVMVGTFYFTHSPMTIGRIGLNRDMYSPYLGFYQVGILSPFERLFVPGGSTVARMDAELTQTNVRGYYPSMWGAAFLDFGLAGGLVYLLLIGLFAGYCWRSSIATPSAASGLGMSFAVSTFILSPVNGPLGVANSALVLGSVMAVGLFVDLVAARQRVASGSRLAKGAP